MLLHYKKRRIASASKVTSGALEGRYASVESHVSVTSVERRYVRVSKAKDGLRQAFMDELAASLA